MEGNVTQQSVDMPHSGRDSEAQGSEVDDSLARSRLGLLRMDQSVATESNRSMYPPPGLDDPNHVTVHPSASTTVTTGHPNMTRRPVPGRRRTPSQTSTAAPLPLEDGSSLRLDLDTIHCQSALMRQDFWRTSGQGRQNFQPRHFQKEECWDLLTPLRRCQVF